MIGAAIFRILFEMLSSPVTLEMSTFPSSFLTLEGVTSLITKEEFALFKYCFGSVITVGTLKAKLGPICAKCSFK